MTDNGVASMVHHGLRIVLGLVFVSTGSIKLWDISTFTSHLGDFGLVVDAWVPATARMVSLAEVGVGIGLMAGWRWSLGATLALLLMFVGALAYGIALGLDIDCGCFGPAFSVELKTQVLIDLGLIGWCGLVYLTGRHHRRREKTTDSRETRASSIP